MRSPMPHAWSLISVGLHLLTAVLMVIVVANAWDSGTRGAVLASAGVMGGIHLVGTTRWVSRSRAASLLWLGCLVAAWLVLLVQVPDAVFLAFPLYFLTAHLLTDRWALVAVAALAGCAVVGFSAHRGFSVAVAIGPVLGAVVALGTVLGLRVVDRESARRGVLEERERLAREIHDTLAQGFASVNLLLGAAAARLSAPAEQGEEAARARDLVEQARDVAVANLTEARRFVHALAPAPMSQSALVETLRRTVADLAGPEDLTARTRVAFAVDGSARAVSGEVEVALLRIAREAVTNARRYAHASRVAVTLTWLDDAVALDVVDDGVGFDPTQPSRGFGLTSMRSRASDIGGTFHLESGPQRGTAVTVTLPIDASGTPR